MFLLPFVACAVAPSELVVNVLDNQQSRQQDLIHNNSGGCIGTRDGSGPTRLRVSMMHILQYYTSKKKHTTSYAKLGLCSTCRCGTYAVRLEGVCNNHMAN